MEMRTLHSGMPWLTSKASPFSASALTSFEATCFTTPFWGHLSVPGRRKRKEWERNRTAAKEARRRVVRVLETHSSTAAWCFLFRAIPYIRISPAYGLVFTITSFSFQRVHDTEKSLPAWISITSFIDGTFIDRYGVIGTRIVNRCDGFSLWRTTRRRARFIFSISIDRRPGRGERSLVRQIFTLRRGKFVRTLRRIKFFFFFLGLGRVFRNVTTSS